MLRKVCFLDTCSELYIVSETVRYVSGLSINAPLVTVHGRLMLVDTAGLADSA